MWPKRRSFIQIDINVLHLVSVGTTIFDCFSTFRLRSLLSLLFFCSAFSFPPPSFTFHFLWFSFLLFYLFAFPLYFVRLVVCVFTFMHTASIHARLVRVYVNIKSSAWLASNIYVHIYMYVYAPLRHGTSANKLSLLRIAYKCLLNHGFLA